MEVKAGYKRSEVGVIPEDWDVARLGAYADVTKLAGFEYTNHFNSYKDGGDIIVVRGTNITHNSLDLSDVRTIPRSVSDKLPRSKLKKDDLVFAYVGTIGPVFLIEEDDRYHLGPNTARITCEGGLNPRFAFCYFESELIGKEITERISTGAQPSLSMAKIRAFRILKPTDAEQRAIAAALSDVDALISSLDKLIAKKRDIKQAAMQQLLIGNRRLPGFGGEWETRSFDELFEFLNTASNPRADLADAGDIGYVHYGDIHTRSASFMDCSTEALPRIAGSAVASAPYLENGDLIMVDASEDYDGLGKSVEVANVDGRKIVAGLHTFLLRGRPGLLANGFKGYMQNMPEVRRALTQLATGISVYGVSKNNLKSVRVLLPRVEEQQAIAAVLSDMDADIAALEQRRDKTRLIKQGMMQELLTGRIRLV